MSTSNKVKPAVAGSGRTERDNFDPPSQPIDAYLVAESRARLESYAIATAALLKADHDAAIRRGTQIVTQVNAASRLILSGATDRVVSIPGDVDFDALLAARCDKYPARSTIRFFSSGMSCGGVIELTRLGFGYQIRVNWLTGGVEIVALRPA